MTVQKLLDELHKIPEEERDTTLITKWDDYHDCEALISSLERSSDYPDTYILW